MPRVAKPKPDRLILLDQALTCLAEQGPQATSIDVLTAALAISHRTFYEVLGTKAVAVEAVYAHAMNLLTAHLAPPRPREPLLAYLTRCWQHTAQAALAQPRVFAFWQHYRTSPHVRAAATFPTGPFAQVLAVLLPLVGRPGQLSTSALPLPVGSRGLVAQWSAAVEVALEEAACQQDEGLRGRVLSRGFEGWWKGTGWSATLVVAPVAGAKPATTTNEELWRWVGKALEAQQASLPPSPPLGRGSEPRQ